MSEKERNEEPEMPINAEQAAQKSESGDEAGPFAVDFSGDAVEGKPGERSSEGEQARMPKPTFSTFVLSLASSALVQLGEVPDPGTGKNEVDLVMAKHTIDILSMLQEKVKSGLEGEESRLLEGLLYELRMKFVMKK